jgi:hypothetical protein
MPTERPMSLLLPRLLLTTEQTERDRLLSSNFTGRINLAFGCSFVLHLKLRWFEEDIYSIELNIFYIRLDRSI